ncbi:MAG: PHB depolymerase family esterase [Pseudomonadota bacterium]
MVKRANPWLSGLLRAGKKQRRALTSAVIGMLAVPKPKPKPKPPVAAKRVQPGLAARVTPVAGAAAKRGAAKRPPPAPPLGKWLASHYASVGELPARRMQYWLYLPHAIEAVPGGLPLLVMLHGCEQSATEFARGTRMNALAERAGFAVLYPQQALSSHPKRCWKWYDRATQQGGGDTRVIAGMVEQIAHSYPIDRSRIYICGMSAGAGMANIVALNHPDLFAAQGLHSGPVFGGGHSTLRAVGVMQHGDGMQAGGAIDMLLARRPRFPPLPTMLIQGEADRVVRPVNQDQLARQATQVNGLGPDSAVKLTVKAGTSRTHPYRLRDVLRGRKVMLRVAQIGELGHAWSGGDASLPFHAGRGPDASKMLLDFFSRHRRGPAPD